MSNHQKTILKAFNQHFDEFVKDVQHVFPRNMEILSSKNALYLIQKINPKLLIQFWKLYILDKYKNEIEAGDIDFFIKRDYTQDIPESEKNQESEIIKTIESIRKPLIEMDEENLKKVLEYLQNLTQLCYLYFA
jgi:hypothetical protein